MCWKREAHKKRATKMHLTKLDAAIEREFVHVSVSVSVSDGTGNLNSAASIYFVSSNDGLMRASERAYSACTYILMYVYHHVTE